MAQRMTQAERQARKTLHGEWRTPIPINFIDDPDRPHEDEKKYYSGKVRNRIRLIVQMKEVRVYDQIKIERHVTLEYYGHNQETGEVNLEDLHYTVQGKANLRYDRIKWNNGCCWARVGATQKDRDDIKQGRSFKMLVEEEQKAAPPPDLFGAEGGTPKRFQPLARHAAPAPDWDRQVAEVQRVMIQQLKEIETEVARRQSEADDLSVALKEPCEQVPQTQIPRLLVTDPMHSALPPEGEDTEASAHGSKVLRTDAELSMWNCCACGNTPKVLDEEEEEEAQEPEEPLPEARDLSDGFFDQDQVDDVIDRINDVVGIWGISEATEREFIKPPVEAMNKLIKGAMSTFLSSPLMDLLSYLMDDSLDISVKCTKIGQYIHDEFVKPLCTALVDALSASFESFSWIKNQVTKVIMMMSQMVTDEVVSKSVEQLNDSDIVD